ncbi:DUF397 domain-containing protein [Actinoallomurus sp. NPDC052308]
MTGSPDPFWRVSTHSSEGSGNCVEVAVVTA